MPGWPVDQFKYEPATDLLPLENWMPAEGPEEKTQVFDTPVLDPSSHTELPLATVENMKLCSEAYVIVARWPLTPRNCAFAAAVRAELQLVAVVMSW